MINDPYIRLKITSIRAEMRSLHNEALEIEKRRLNGQMTCDDLERAASNELTLALRALGETVE